MFKSVHIIKAEMADAEDLSGIKFIYPDKCIVPQTVAFEKIDAIELIGAKVASETEKKQKLYTTTVSLKVKGKESFDGHHKVLRLTSANGEQYLVGTDSRPYVTIKTEDNWPEKHPDNACMDVTATWTSVFPMLHIIN